MNNSINAVSGNNNISFNSRYLRIITPENFPKELLDSIKTNKPLDEFIQAGKPKTLWEKFIDLFKRNEYLNVYYNKFTSPKTDKYYSEEQLSFLLGKDRKNGSFFHTNSLDINATQQGIKRQQGSIPKPGEDYRFKPPVETAAQRIIKAFESITDFKEKIDKPYAVNINA